MMANINLEGLMKKTIGKQNAETGFYVGCISVSYVIDRLFLTMQFCKEQSASVLAHHDWNRKSFQILSFAHLILHLFYIRAD